VLDELDIQSPKRHHRVRSGWGGFFPYYAGFSETFAYALLRSAGLHNEAIVFDPWNGSGTTTFAASRLGLKSWGSDLNPVMVVIARARLLPPSEADSIASLATKVVNLVESGCCPLDNDALSLWFSDTTASTIRAIEQGIRQLLVGPMTITSSGVELDCISGLAAAFYVALFTVCRELVARFRSSNPTWLRQPRDHESRADVPGKVVREMMVANLKGMAHALVGRQAVAAGEPTPGRSQVKLADTATIDLPAESVDLILTSPPYCTRIDYTAATRIELAVLDGLIQTVPKTLSLQMIGSIRVPPHEIEISPLWGKKCGKFLNALRKHPSKASAGYYYKTHLDYFDKIFRSMTNVVYSLKSGGTAVVVVQDSYYKNVHNDLPSIMTEIAEARGLRICQRNDFRMTRSMSGINPYTRHYNRAAGSIESVICFVKQ
jgi:DNA modification methylase